MNISGYCKIKQVVHSQLETDIWKLIYHQVSIVGTSNSRFLRMFLKGDSLIANININIESRLSETNLN